MPKEPITHIDLPQPPKWALDLATEVRRNTKAVDDMRAAVEENTRVVGQIRDELDVLRSRVRDLEVAAE